MDNANQKPGPEAEVEALLTKIRDRIEATRGTAAAADKPDNLAGPLSASYYESLADAREAQAKIRPGVAATRVTIPLIGPILTGLRRKIHELVLFYIGQAIARQSNVNAQLLQAIVLLGDEVATLKEEQR